MAFTGERRGERDPISFTVHHLFLSIGKVGVNRVTENTDPSGGGFRWQFTKRKRICKWVRTPTMLPKHNWKKR